MSVCDTWISNLTGNTLPIYEQLQLQTKQSLSLFVQQKKEKRRKVLEAVRQRRKGIEKSFQKKVQQPS